MGSASQHSQFRSSQSATRQSVIDGRPLLTPAQVTLYHPGQASDEPGDGGVSGDEEGGGEERLGRISFVDLAGSERAQRTGNVGVRLK